MKNMFRAISWAVIVYAPSLVSAQSLYVTPILVDGNAKQAECNIHINRKDPSRLIAATNRGVFYKSSDGGLNWEEDDLINLLPDPIWADPVFSSDTSGRYYFHAIHPFPPLFPDTTSPGLCFLRSDDYGETWGVQSNVGIVDCFNDKPWLVTDWVPTSPFNGRVYSTWSMKPTSICPTDAYLFVTHSEDGGVSWVEQDTLDVQPYIQPYHQRMVVGSSIAISSTGTVGVTWSGGLPNQIHFKKSTDGGETWPSTPTIIDDNVLPDSAFFTEINSSLWFGTTFTSLACDASTGIYGGNYYCVWSDMRNGVNNYDIFLARSTNGGVTWETQRINDDTTTRNQVQPMVAVDPTTGWVYVSYMDARTNADAFDDTLHYYIAWSFDGGQTFENVQASQKPSVANDEFEFLAADYMGLDALAGKAHLLWGILDDSTANTELWSAIVSLEHASQRNVLSEGALVLYPGLPNPAINFTTFDFQLPTSSRVSFFVTDASGKRTEVHPVDKKFQPGRHQIRLEHVLYKLGPGLYVFTAITEAGVVSRKFEVMK